MYGQTLKRALAASIVVIGGTLLSPGTARAATLDFTGLGHYANVTVSLTGKLTEATFAAGELNWAWLGGVPDGASASIYSYCVDVTTALVDPQIVSVLTTTNMPSAAAGARVAWLFNTFAASVRQFGTNADAAGLQVAIWEALYDSSNDLAGGDFRLSTTGAVRTAANTFLTQLYTPALDGSAVYANSVTTWLDTNRGQDQITAKVPEPSLLLLMGLGGAAAWSQRRRRTVA